MKNKKRYAYLVVENLRNLRQVYKDLHSGSHAIAWAAITTSVYFRFSQNLRLRRSVVGSRFCIMNNSLRWVIRRTNEFEMNLRVVLLCVLLVSYVQINAQEIIAKFNTLPTITVSNEMVCVKLDYTIRNAKGYEIALNVGICDSNKKEVLSELKEFTPTDDSGEYQTTYTYPISKFKANGHSPFFLDAAIYWRVYAGKGHDWVFTDKIPFSLKINSSSSSSNSTAYQEKKVCSYCNGTGFVKCSHCDGYGYLEPGFGPRGNGKIGGGNTTCPECRGA